MTPEEQEIWFLELLEKILEDTIEKKKAKPGTDIYETLENYTRIRSRQ